MTVEDFWALLVLVILLLSTLIWVGPWVNFIVKAWKTQSVNNRAMKQTSIRIGIGAFFSGLLLVIMGLVLRPPPSGAMPAVEYLSLFTICPSMFVLAALVGFLRSAMELRRKYQLPAEPEDDEQDLAD